MFNPNGIQTSGTYNYWPTTPEIIIAAFARCQIRRTELTETHLTDAMMEFNAYLSTFNDLGPNLAQVQLQTFNTVAGTTTYNIPVNVVQILDMYIRIGTPPSNIDYYIWPISRTEYDSISNKFQMSRPTQYWFNRQINPPVVTFYFTPDQVYEVFYHCFLQVQDSVMAGNSNPEVPNRAIDALIAGLAHRLARIYAPSLEAARKADATEAWSIYAKQDTENVNLYITPALGGYWRV